MKVQEKHGKVTQNMHGASRNYRYVWDVSIVHSKFLRVCAGVNMGVHGSAVDYWLLKKGMLSYVRKTFCRDPGLAYVISVMMQSHGEPRTVPTCLSRQGQAQNVLEKHRTWGHPIRAG